MNIVVGGKYQTRGDKKYPSSLVRILATDMKGADGTVLGLVIGSNGCEFPCCWKADGKSLELGVTESVMDLVPVPEQGLNIHTGGRYQTKKDGYKVDIFCDHGPNKVAPIAGYITINSDSHILASWQPGGVNCSAGYNKNYELVPVPDVLVPVPEPKPEKYHGYLMLSRWTRFFLLTEEEAKKKLPHTHDDVRVRLEDDY